MNLPKGIAIPALTIICLSSAVQADPLCQGYGPQTPRDISNREGLNLAAVALAPKSSEMNLCNLHTHTNAEHKGPGFTVSAGGGDFGGYRCNETKKLTETELSAPSSNAYHGVKPGDTIEVHWVYSSCDIEPGKSLGSCMSAACVNPQLRVETQVFLVVNNPEALNFLDFAYGGKSADGLHQPKALPTGTGDPVTFIGSTTGPEYTQAICSPFQVTWSVRPQCAKLDINSLNAWAEAGNVFEEDHSHGIRQLVTAKELLAPIQ